MKTFRIFYSFIWKYKGYFIGSIVTSFFSVMLGNFMPFIYRYLVDNFYNFTISTFLTAAGIYGATRIGMIVFGNISGFLGTKYANPALVDSRVKVFGHLQDLDFVFHTTKKSGELISKIKRGDSAFSNIDQDLNGEFLDDLVRLIIAAFAFYLVSPKLIYIFFTAIFFIVITSIYLIRKNMANRVEFNKEEDKISQLISDNLINYETVKYFANEKREINNLKKTFEQWERSLWKFMISFRKMNISVRLISSLAIISMLGFLTKDIVDKKISVGDFVLVFTFMSQVFPNIEKIMFRFRSIVRNYTDLKDYFAILDYPLAVKDVENPIPFSCDKGEVIFEKIYFSYPGGQEAVKNISVTMPSGMSSALVGRSGSGKTTMTKLLMRVYDPSSGKILIDRCDVSQIKKEDLRRAIGIVPQEPILFNNTIGYNIGYPLENAMDESIKEAAKLANLHDFISTLEKGYDTVVGERGVKLSGGQKQRLAIARVFLLNPKIIIFDEATSHLDSESERLIQDSLERLSKGKTLIIIAHRLSTIMRADKIIVLDNGSILEEGLHDELISKTGGIYKKLWELQTNHEIE
ncbi:MAG: Multidrug resistance protein Atm1 [Candidatus Amesbacteria bacterium GW2011_GWA2_42_12]|uniref:Multidrug resistance protein Atm1 n=1 Tax=Candidatus Amesbacteria bacterium GW2011_GWA2_42_12 TaxID=1618356 RepID=A0A0G1AC45_9BACT|nr:MAG: Multidrug resistance protein Atm1 [Candidatus Amesbacteria bacterium GW2011_GWA2_42_12]